MCKFKIEPSRELSTSEVVRVVLVEESCWVTDVLSGVQEKAQLILAKRKKGQLHRKVLYYLNKLTEEEKIVQTKVTGKGEKYFVLNIEKNKNKTHSSFFDSSRIQLITPIEGYEKQGLINKLGGEAWSSRVSSIMIDASKFSGVFKLQGAISECFTEINEAIGVYRFEKIIEEGDVQAIREGLHRLDLEAKDFNREVCLLVNMKQVNEDKLKHFIEEWMRLQPEKIRVIWRLDSDWLDRHLELGKYMIKLFSEHKLMLFMANSSLEHSPSFFGKTGIHKMSEEEWESFLKSEMELGWCTMCTLSLDVKRFFNGVRSFQEFRSMVRKAAKALFLGNWAVQDQGASRLVTLSHVNEGTRLFYQLGSNQLRFVNFPVKGAEADHFLSLLESCQAEITRFVKVQETIFKSCGMPLKFKISLGTAEETNQYAYVISKTQDFFKPEFQEYIQRKERLTKVFAGKEALHWMALDGNPEEKLNQIHYVLDHINIPLLGLSFGEEKGVLKLTNFLEVSHGNL